MTNDDRPGRVDEDREGARDGEGGPAAAASQRAHEAAREALTSAVQAAHVAARGIAPVRGEANAGQVARLRGLLETVAAKAPAGLAAVEALSTRAEREETGDVIAIVYARAAAVAHAAGDAAAFEEWLTAAARQAVDSDVLAELAVAREHPDAYCKLVHGRYLFARGKERAARKHWRELGKRAELGSMKKLVEREERAPRALKDGKLPGLWRINGCGVAFYGRRDRWPDGSYATTHCISLIFIPVIPLSAYRVLDSGGGYHILAREQLSTFARAARALVLAAVALLITVSITKSYLNDPSRLAARRVEAALTEASQLAAKSPEAALHKLLGVEEGDLAQAGGKQAERLGAQTMSLTASFIQRPFTRDKLEQAGRMVDRYQRLPFSAKLGGRPVVRAALYDYLADVGAAAADSDVRLALLHHQAALFDGNPPAELTERITKEILVTVAAQKVEWPLEAFELLMDQPQLSSALLAEADALAVRLAEQPMLLGDAGAALDRWLGETSSDQKANVAAKRTAAQQARAAVTGEKLERAQLVAALEQQPWNQAAALQLAGEAASSGKLEEASARLRAIGAPGQMTREARLSLAQLLTAEGKLEEADALLSSLVTPRLARFSAALTAFETAEQAAVERAQNQLRNDPPAQLRARYEALAADEAAQNELVQGWLREQVSADAATKATFTTFEALGDVVPASIELGTVKLRRAQALPEGAAKNELLLAAERAFLGIRAAAEGQDEFRIGLGEIYARLGKVKESEAEIAALLAKNQPKLNLEVAKLYRTLGNYERAKAVAMTIYESASAQPADKSYAAILLSLLEKAVSEDRAVEWLRKADPSDPFVRISLLEDEARKLLREGRRKEAAAAYERAAVAWLGEASARNSAAYNNASIAQQHRFMASGDLDALADAEATMEKAYRISGDNALVVGNFSTTLLRHAYARVLAKRINLRALPIDDSGAADLMATLLKSSDAKEAQLVKSALAASPAQRRGEQMLATFAVLAPSSPEAYASAFRVAKQWRDEAAGAAVVARARAAKNLDTSSDDRATEEWLRGERDAESIAGHRTDVTELTGIAGDSKLDARTRAAAHLLLSDRSNSLAVLPGGTAADADLAATSLEQAYKLWPALTMASRAIQVLIDQAALAADAETWRPLRRKYSAADALERLHKDGHELAAAVLASPQWAQVTAYARADQTRPGIDDLRVARLIGDAALIERAKAVLDDKLTRLDYELDLIVSPKRPATRDILAYLDRR